MLDMSARFSTAAAALDPQPGTGASRIAIAARSEGTDYPRRVLCSPADSAQTRFSWLRLWS
jgi:hypothetical protein